MLEPLSPQVPADALDDPRLKILWIEDVQKGHHAQDIDLGETFSIFLARTPGDIADELPEQRAEVQAVRERGLVYDLDRFPFDGYLTDYNLSRASNPPVSGELPDSLDEVDVADEGGSAATATVTEDSRMRAEAANAEAAGLTAGVLTAINFEGHPAVIVPYTGYEQQLGKQRALIRLLTTDNLVFAQDSLLQAEFSKPEFRTMAEIFSRTYREALPFWALRGLVHLTLKEKQRLKKMVENYSNGGERFVSWQNEFVVFETEYQQRRILLRSLWFRADREGTSADEITAWIDQFPEPSALVKQAKILADQYWEMSNRPESKMRHELSETIEDFHKHSATSKPDALYLDRMKNFIRKHCDRLMIRWEDALQPDTKLEVTEPGFGGVRHLMVCGENKNVCRLAVLMILVVEYKYRRQLIYEELSEELRPFFKEHSAIHPQRERMTVSLEKILRWSLRPEAKEAVQKLLWYGVKTLDYEEQEVRIPRLGPPRAEDLHCRLDPLPISLVTKWDSVEKSLSRGEKAFLKLTELIANGKDSGLQPEEQRELQRFAREIEFPRSLWPDWLTSNIRTSKLDEAGAAG